MNTNTTTKINLSDNKVIAVSNGIELEIETPAIGDILMDVPYNKDGAEQGNVIINVPNWRFWGMTSHTNIDLTYIVENDIKQFEELNARSNEKHQVYIDTLCLYGIKIAGSRVRLLYWFNQDNDPNSHRMCAGAWFKSINRGNHLHKDGEITKMYEECYSNDACVYW